ncbi:oxidoreductase-like protein [Microthyrium microscopicum]|uniref:Oxidoreductase-like protein n=1 Tax=Microthyrium microscopicum TaxID=703497 RepID=A0A6A6U846_9PEZI|nr:oxidoreductase-like protein [Microthyrium microscopicum]
MPIPLLEAVATVGVGGIPYLPLLLKIGVVFGLLYLIKNYTAGATNPSERVLHSKVAIVTGGTSGVGAALVRELATRGCQLVLLVRHPLDDAFQAAWIEDLRATTGNELISAEHVDLASLHSVRQFATKWIDNKPARRLDLVILCGDECTPGIQRSIDGAERMMAVNYLSNFHLASILSPALRAQPADRDVRVITGMCASYMGGDLGELAQVEMKENKTKKTLSMKDFTPSKIYGTTKLALLTFCLALQKHLTETGRGDGLPTNIRVLCVDPGWTRTPGMRRYLTRGTLWGLFLYLVTYPFWWLILKSPEQGAQSFLWAVTEASLAGHGQAKDGFLVKECQVVPIQRPEVHNEETQKRLWETTEETIQSLEKESAIRRTKEKKAQENATNTNVKTESGNTQPGSTQPGSRRSKRIKAIEHNGEVKKE